MHVYIPFQILFPYSLLHNVEYSSPCYTVGSWLFIYFMHSSVYMILPVSWFIPPSTPLHFYFSLSCIGERKGNPLQCSCLENPGDGGAWWAAISGVSQSWTRLKQLSSSSSHPPFPLVALSLFSVSVSLFVFSTIYRFICVMFLIPHMWYHMVFVFLFLTYFT